MGVCSSVSKCEISSGLARASTQTNLNSKNMNNMNNINNKYIKYISSEAELRTTPGNSEIDYLLPSKAYFYTNDDLRIAYSAKSDMSADQQQINRNATESLLKNCEPGTYLARFPSCYKSPGGTVVVFSIVVSKHGDFTHVLLHRDRNSREYMILSKGCQDSDRDPISLLKRNGFHLVYPLDKNLVMPYMRTPQAQKLNRTFVTS
mmetsp:Transcript_22336/g.31264  ORF Transcript_22336/g.31264 Transcript_22336/m.31264 type:complete len:205 (+) Transcript_22336:235-849(+)